MISEKANLIFHIVKRAAWEDALQRGLYAPVSLETGGFIHCSTGAQVLETANRWYLGQADLLLLSIDPLRLRPELRYEPPVHPSDERSSQTFPHVYGPLNLDAVTQATAFPREADGFFRLAGAAGV
jgi:uncharacterized protein (DUF952 family)